MNDEAALPWLVPEKRFIAQAIDEGVAVLGICLGAQLIAATQGKRVYPNPEKEMGWHSIQGTSRSSCAFHFPDHMDVLHWHGETFDLPADAVHLASSAVCINQAFQLGDRVVGLQFHMEMNRDSVAAILHHCVGDLTAGNYVQSAEIIRSAPDERYDAVKRMMGALLSYITRDRGVSFQESRSDSR